MRIRIRQNGMRVFLALAGALLTQAGMYAQTQQSPATDSSAEASPLRPAPHVAATDSSVEASPVPGGPASGPAVSIAPHTAIAVKLDREIDSGKLENGDTVGATLLRAVAIQPRGELQAGTPVMLTVIETLPAGRLYSAGEFSLQVVRVGKLAIYTNTLTYRGKPGHKDVPDSAPSVGTDAGLPAGAPITFHVLPAPTAATGPPRGQNGGPGGVNGVAPGAAPPASPTKSSGTPSGGGMQSHSPKTDGAPLKNAPSAGDGAAAGGDALPSSPSTSGTAQPHR